MRILEVRFKNLNSLVGDWRVDLTHPAFAADGLFAITGPTGAGKTTILDAICLALYGRTPRLNKVTRSGNEIMSRQTGECYAEVAFQTPSGRYRCHWSQHRARKRSLGDLQAPKHEIADADSGEIFEAKIRGVADRIESATGMDFERFTRSMLLAQGGFAAFLQAPADERAPILEQITGTEIYSRISVRVHERRSEERKILDALRAELAGMSLLTPEDEQQLADGLARKTQQDAELAEQIEQCNQAVAWLEGMARLQAAVRQLESEQEDWSIRSQAFAEQEKRLTAAKRALEVAGDFATLNEVRRAQESEMRSLRQCLESLPARQAAADREVGLEKTTADRLNARKTEQQQALPVIRQVQRLDPQIAQCEAPIQAAAETVAECETSLAALRAAKEKDESDLENNQRALADVRRQLDEATADEDLVEQLAGLRERFEALRKLHRQSAAGAEALAQADGDLRQASQHRQAQVAVLDTEKRDRGKIQQDLAEKQSALQATLEGREPGAWRDDLLRFAAAETHLEKALETAESRTDSERALGELTDREAALRGESSRLTEQRGEKTKTRLALEKEATLLDTQLILLQKIQDLEQTRRQLRDGEPCPLCGAEEHPFAEGNIPVPDETRRRLDAIKADSKAADKEISALQVASAQVRKDLEQVARDQTRHTENMAKSDDIMTGICADLSLDARDPALKQTLKVKRSENLKALEHATRVVQAVEALEKTANALLERLDTAQASVAEAERKALAAAHGEDSAAQTLKRLRSEAAELKGDREQSLALLLGDVRAFGINALSMDDLDVVQAQLTERREAWIQRNKECERLERSIAAAELKGRHRGEQIHHTATELDKHQAARADLLGRRETLREQRRVLFESKDPDDEERRLAAALESADEDLQAARDRLNGANKALGELKSGIDGLKNSTVARDQQLSSVEADFLARLTAGGFSSEADYQAACLPEDARKTLAEQSRKLADEKTELVSKRDEKTTLLAMERQKQMTEQSLAELQETLTALSAQQKELQQEMGGIRHRLEDNQRLQQQQLARAQALDAHTRECRRWDVLHDLIGSADGKKYRNFAQGITFDMMIGHANRQLRKMSDRYLLIRDDRQPLELNVIDSYQAAEIRSTKNLSGGESFIVSLALALGLSQMASRNVRVDSLFLDEGFGTLDEEALDTALETLAGLRQDGKLIGVISHVQALKDRIGTRIQISPTTGGHSVISGPGCAQTD